MPETLATANKSSSPATTHGMAARSHFSATSSASSFQVQEIDAKPTFKSVEQLYQHAKAKTMVLADERFTDRIEPPISSWDLETYILMLEAPGDCARAGRSFRDFEQSDPDWWETWFQVWAQGIETILEIGLYCMFRQDDHLALILMMTGEFKLVAASPWDSSCGIGYSAGEAMRKKEKWGLNLLGEMLMKVREQMRRLYQLPRLEYAFTFWRAYEESLNDLREKESNVAANPNEHTKMARDRARLAHEDRMQELKDEWVVKMGVRQLEVPSFGIEAFEFDGQGRLQQKELAQPVAELEQTVPVGPPTDDEMLEDCPGELAHHAADLQPTVPVEPSTGDETLAARPEKFAQPAAHLP